MNRTRFSFAVLAVTCLTIVCAAAVLQAVVPPQAGGIATKAFRKPGLFPAPDLRPGDASSLAALGVRQGQAFRDARTGRWGTIVLQEEIVAGGGNGNDSDAIAAAARAGLSSFLEANANALNINPEELAQPQVTVHDGGRLIQIRAPRTVGGLPVRDSEVSAVVNSGNLVLLGLHNWADAPGSIQPAVGAAAAQAALAGYVAPFTPQGFRRAARLELVPFAGATGLGYRLVWVFSPSFQGSAGTWEALVDAMSAEVLAFRDLNHYATQRSVVGGVLPVSNDNVEPDGVEQPDFPMPFADLTEVGTQRKVVTDSGGNAPVCMDGPMFMQFDSQFVKMLDFCGAAPVVPTTGDTLDLGIAGYPNIDPHPGTNCALVTSPTSSAVPGNTRASRSGFYEVNRLKEQARGQLPENRWLRDQITARMNIPGACNAFWDGSTINFYPDTAACRNTGEIAAVFDHEWGHGMDANDARGGVSSPGESVADTYANLRLAQSCTGRGFVRLPPDAPVTLGCGHGYGDPCTDCAGGIRDSDFLKHESQQPHDVAWALAECVSTDPTDQLGPCDGETHCEGTFVAEATWDLLARDLRCQGPGWSVGGAGDVGGGQCAGGAAALRDFPTSLELATKLVFQGGGFVNNWFQCTTDGTAGCNADGGYLNYIAADDDNGNLNDGTPHMSAIHAAFARHGIACSAIPVQDSGCAGAPTAAPVVTATPFDKSVKLTWTPVGGATRYEIFRTEGVFQCDFGKIKVGETTGTEFLVTGLSNAFEVYFTVAAVGSTKTCLGPMSACTPATPVAGAGLTIDTSSLESEIQTGDGDLFLDNCEEAEVRFTVANSGTGPLTNVRIVSVSSPSHPDTTTTTPLPAVFGPSVASCGEAEAVFSIVAAGLANNDVLQLEVEVTSDELAAGGGSRSATFELRTTEGDFRSFASQLFDFESGAGMWRKLYGSFAPATAGGGADGTGAYLASSSFNDSACDGMATPLLRLTAASTFELSTNFDIEPATAAGAAAWDRANVRLLDLATGGQTLVTPSGGRTYNVLPGSAGAFSGACLGMELQHGWGDAMPTWAGSSFSAADLGAAEAAGKPVQIVVQYGSDAAAALRGFWFDQVRVNNAEIEVLDTQDDACRAPCSELDDADPAIEYTGGWHRKADPAATNGGYHRRTGNNKKGAAARVVFEGDAITYLYAVSSPGGTADVFIDGVLRETISYEGAGEVSFGRAVTYAGLGGGTHELKIVHRTGHAYVDGFRINCDGSGGADASAPQFVNRTETSTASASDGPIISRKIQVGSQAVEVSVVVEGSAAPLTVQLLGPLGQLVAQGSALINGLSVSGLDAAVGGPATYTVNVPNSLTPGETVSISVAVTERR